MGRARKRKLERLDGKDEISCQVTERGNHPLIAKTLREKENRRTRINWKKNLEEIEKKLKSFSVKTIVDDNQPVIVDTETNNETNNETKSINPFA